MPGGPGGGGVGPGSRKGTQAAIMKRFLAP